MTFTRFSHPFLREPELERKTLRIKYMTKLLALSLFVLVPLLLLGQDAESILSEIERRQKLVKSEQVKIQMIMKEGNAEKRKRVLTSSTLVDDEERTRSLIKFDYPPDLRGTGLLTIETDGKDIQKLFLPALKKVQRISGRKKGQSFVGSDFSFEDLGTRKPEDYDSGIINRDEKSVTISSIPKEIDEYSELRLSVDTSKMVVTDIEYFDLDGKVIKRFEAREFENIHENTFRARLFTMHDISRERSTIMRVLSRNTKKNLDKSYFSDRELSR